MAPAPLMRSLAPNVIETTGSAEPTLTDSFQASARHGRRGREFELHSPLFPFERQHVLEPATSAAAVG